MSICNRTICEGSTVLVEIIRDSKNKYFFRDRELFKLLWSKFQDRELLGSRIIRHVRIRTFVRASPAAICIESDDDVVEPRRSRRKRLNRQSRLHCLPDKFRHLGHGPRCDSDGLGPERRPNGP